MGPAEARAVDLRHVPLAELPGALALLHASLSPGRCVELRLPPGIGGPTRALLLESAGFEPSGASLRARRAPIRVERRVTLPDFVAPGLRLLVCGLNPSVYAAETGIPFGRPGNRFWPAAARAGLIERDRDCMAALRAGLGFTDWVKRPTRRAAELAPGEYRAGLARIERISALFRPRALCFVGLEGFRRAIDRRARPGWSSRTISGVAAYVMPSTSGLNAHATLEELAGHLRRAAAGPAA